MEFIRRTIDRLRVKITLPYAFLALVIAFATAFLITRLLVGVLEDRFQNVLLDAGYKVADEVVRVEQEQLDVWRAIAYTQGFRRSVMARDSNRIGALASPQLINARLDCLDVLDVSGRPLYAMHHEPEGGVTDYEFEPGEHYADWEIVQKVLDGKVDVWGDKYADLIETDWGWVFYTSGPIKREDQVIGVLLVGTYLDRLVLRLDNAALARVTLYAGSYSPLVSTLAAHRPEILTLSDQELERYLAKQEEQVFRRDLEVDQRQYAELFGAFEVRHGSDLGVFSVALPLSFVTNASQPTVRGLTILFAVTTALVLFVGLLVAHAVVRRVRRLAAATHRVAQGHFNVQVGITGRDEIACLAQDFDWMVQQLEEGRLYRDLLGLTASPAVAEQLKQARHSGVVKLQGQTTIATVLFVDIRGFTRLAENEAPADIIELLNEYLGGVATLVRRHQGVVNKFVGDATLAFFGILPEPCEPRYSARNALLTGLSITEYVRKLNEMRAKQDKASIRIGVGINTDFVVAGLLGAQERFEYTILGDAVNVAQRLSEMNKRFPQYDIFMSAGSKRLLGEDFSSRLESLDEQFLRGRVMPVKVYAVA